MAAVSTILTMILAGTAFSASSEMFSAAMDWFKGTSSTEEAIARLTKLQEGNIAHAKTSLVSKDKAKGLRQKSVQRAQQDLALRMQTESTPDRFRELGEDHRAAKRNELMLKATKLPPSIMRMFFPRVEDEAGLHARSFGQVMSTAETVPSSPMEIQDASSLDMFGLEDEELVAEAGA